MKYHDEPNKYSTTKSGNHALQANMNYHSKCKPLYNHGYKKWIG